jgi:hypothetical protein
LGAARVDPESRPEGRASVRRSLEPLDGEDAPVDDGRSVCSVFLGSAILR